MLLDANARVQIFELTLLDVKVYENQLEIICAELVIKPLITFLFCSVLIPGLEPQLVPVPRVLGESHGRSSHRGCSGHGRGSWARYEKVWKEIGTFSFKFENKTKKRIFQNLPFSSFKSLAELIDIIRLRLNIVSKELTNFNPNIRASNLQVTTDKFWAEYRESNLQILIVSVYLFLI